jgi:peptide/nickel transport system ATP-binding protein
MSLEIQNLTVTYTKRRQTIAAVEDVSLRIHSGEILGLVGESGSGKSTLALSILRLLPHTSTLSGKILWNGKNLLTLSQNTLNQIRGKEIAFIFQEPSAYLNPVISVGTQAAEPLWIHERIPFSKALLKVQSLFSDLGIPPQRLSQYSFEMSGGQLQRVLTATALITEPQLILADEPSTALDSSSQKQLLEIFKRLRDEHQTSFLIITHDLPMIASVADTLAVMYCGRLVEKGKTDQVLSHPLHPYTQGLLTTENLPARWEPLKTIEGEVPNPAHKPSGCAFHPRCPKASALCKDQIPEWREHQPDHFAACFHTS